MTCNVPYGKPKSSSISRHSASFVEQYGYCRWYSVCRPSASGATEESLTFDCDPIRYCVESRVPLMTLLLVFEQKQFGLVNRNKAYQN